MRTLPQRISQLFVRLPMITTTVLLFSAATMFGGTAAEGSTTSAAVTTSTGRLTCKPSALNFGSVTLRHAKSMTVTITNTGSSRLTVTKRINVAPGFWLSNLHLPVTLNVGRSVQFYAYFHPPASGPASGHIYLISNASNPKLAIAFSGMGVGSNSLAPNPSNIGFGSVQIGKSLTRYESLTNAGTSSITVSSAMISGSGFSWGGLRLPLTLAAGHSVTFSVTFTPKTTATASGSVSVNSSASNSKLKVNLTGRGGPPSALTVTTAPLPKATVGTAYSTTVSASGGTPPYRWALASGHLPAGLALASTGVISGKPTTAGSSTLTVQVSDSASAVAKAGYTLNVVAASAGGLGKDCTLYASATGNDNNSGTSPSSPKTLAGASSKTVPGSVVCLLGGTYNLSRTFYPSHAGNSSAWITYKNYGDSAAVLVWHGGSSQSDTSMVNFYNSRGFSSGRNYIEVRGLKFNGQNQSSVALTCHWSHHLRFVNNTITNMGAAGISSKFCDYITANHNLIYHTGYLQGWSSGISLNSNQWYDAYAGFHSNVVNNIISGTVDNSRYHSDGNGIIMDLSNNSYDYSTANTPRTLIANNVIYQNGGRCIEIYVVTNIWTVNNTCYKNALDTREAGIGEIVSNKSNNSYFINNVVYSWNGRQPYQKFASNSNIVYYKNMYYGGSNNFTYSDSSQFINANPLFLSPPYVDPTASGQYANAQMGDGLRLQSTSPAINKGLDPSMLRGLSTEVITGLRQYLYTDINGLSRPQGSAFDLGASRTPR